VSVPAVSVLMPAYNREAYIGDAIESVLAQHFADFELVVVDDRSSDRTRAIAESYASKDARVRVMANEKNLGQFENRNRAASLAHAPLLKFHDSDDVMYPHCLEVMVAAMAAAPEAAVGLSQGRSWPGGACPMVLTPQLAYTREFLGHGLFQCGPGGSIIRRDAFDAVGGFRTAGIHSDYLLWLDMARRFSFVLMPADLFWYREHPEQDFRSARAVRDYARLAGEVWKTLHDPACPLDGGALEIARRNQTYNVVKQLWRDVRRGDIATALYRVRHAGLSPVDWFRYLRKPLRQANAGTPLPCRGGVSTSAKAMADRSAPPNG
jgi:glycosyltransferase involved in cell wall biosynthesis